jgi:hypothetical protein
MGARHASFKFHFKRIFALSIAVVLAFGGIVASAEEPTYQELQQQIKNLESRLAAVENRSAINTADVDANVRRVIEDSEKRSRLLAVNSDITSGYDKGFFIRNADGTFYLRPIVQAQFRAVGNINDSSGEDSDTDIGFEVRRARFGFDGNVISPKLTYTFIWDTNRSGGSVTLLDAWLQYKFAENWAIWFGQFKESVLHEKDISDSALMAVDRGLVDAILGGSQTDRVQGISLVYGGSKGKCAAG